MGKKESKNRKEKKRIKRKETFLELYASFFEDVLHQMCHTDAQNAQNELREHVQNAESEDFA